mmetsp:Transcript_21455/g.68373  ORF Transcript_21455/g.68373 Transcript_21455/m.68373 type:complete len:204 (-) Transcript_21455:1036-1647(-)
MSSRRTGLRASATWRPRSPSPVHGAASGLAFPEASSSKGATRRQTLSWTERFSPSRRTSRSASPRTRTSALPSCARPSRASRARRASRSASGTCASSRASWKSRSSMTTTSLRSILAGRARAPLSRPPRRRKTSIRKTTTSQPCQMSGSMLPCRATTSRSTTSSLWHGLARGRLGVCTWCVRTSATRARWSATRSPSTWRSRC